MRIEFIKNKGKNIKEIHISDNFYFSIDLKTLQKYNLKIDNEYDEEFLNRIKNEADMNLCKARALNLLEYRDHTKQELKEKLIKVYSEDIADSVIDYLEELRLIDEDNMAIKLANQYIFNKKYGMKKVCYELKLKGIPKEKTDKLLSNIEVDFVKILVDLIERKYKQKLLSNNGEQKVVAALARKGHDFNDIKLAIDKIKE